MTRRMIPNSSLRPSGGCLPLDTPERRKNYDRLRSSAVSLDFAWQNEGDGVLPIIDWDDAFDDLIDERSEILNTLRESGELPLPWEILHRIPQEKKRSDRLYFSQGSRDSCASHADAFATEESILYEQFLGSPLVYDSFNPIYQHYASKGDRMGGGQTIPDMAEFVNQTGVFPVSDVGDDNQSTPTDWRDHTDAAERYQSAIVFLDHDYPDRIVKACRAGFGIVLGNSQAISGDEDDKNGVPIPVYRGWWAHATGFGAWMETGGTEYVWWRNSHDKIYRSFKGSPQDGLWTPISMLPAFCRSIDNYGSAYVKIPRAIICRDRRFTTDLTS